MHRWMRTAGEHVFGEVRLGQDGPGRGHVERFAAVRRGAQRQLFTREAEPFNAAAFDKRQRLKHLDRRSNEAQVRGISGARHQTLLRVRDRDVNPMLRLDDITTQDFNNATACFQDETHTSATS